MYEAVHETSRTLPTPLFRTFTALAMSDELRLDWRLQPGDLPLLNNLTMLHAKSEFRVRNCGARSRCQRSGLLECLESGWGPVACRCTAISTRCTPRAIEGERVGGADVWAARVQGLAVWRDAARQPAAAQRSHHAAPKARGGESAAGAKARVASIPSASVWSASSQGTKGL